MSFGILCAGSPVADTVKSLCTRPRAACQGGSGKRGGVGVRGGGGGARGVGCGVSGGRVNGSVVPHCHP